MTARFPYSIRTTRSGYGGPPKYLVVRNPGARRVSVHAHLTTESAWMAANGLNIGWMIKPAVEDGRPYDVRLAEAKGAFLAAGNVEHARPVKVPETVA